MHPLRSAMTAGDRPGVAAALAGDVVLHSPITRRPFRGRDEVATLLGHVLDVLDEFAYTTDEALPGGHLLVTRARIGTRTFEVADLLRHDGGGKVDDLTIFVRPMAGTALLAARLGPHVAARHGRVRSAVVAAALAPLPHVLELQDRIGFRLAGPWGGGGRP